MKPDKNQLLSRGAFLKSLGLSTSALMAFYCIGTTMSSCGGKDNDPDPTNGGPGGPGGDDGVTGTTTGNAVNFTVNLGNSNYSSLKTAGNYTIIGDVLIAFTSTGYVALSKTCTHEGFTLRYRSSSNDVFCSNHGSEFTVSGSVQKGPDTGGSIQALKVYNVALSGDGNTLTIKS